MRGEHWTECPKRGQLRLTVLDGGLGILNRLDVVLGGLGHLDHLHRRRRLGRHLHRHKLGRRSTLGSEEEGGRPPHISQ